MSVFSIKRPKIGLALGGGGARGFAHLGACKAFEEFGIKFDYICGTSVGSLVGAFLADGKTYDEMYAIAKKLKAKDIKNSKMFFLPSSTEGLQDIIDKNISVKNIQDLKTEYSCVAVDLISTKECVLTKGELKSAVAASCSVPGVFEPVIIGKKLFCDGGLQDTIPAIVPKMMGCDYVVSVDVNPQRLYGTDSSKVFDVLACTIRILMQNNAEKGYKYSDVMIKPDTKRFKSTKTENMDELISEGYNATIDQIAFIKKLFNQKRKRHRNLNTANIDII